MTAARYPMVKAALRYAELLGWPVIPLWGVQEGRCLCGRVDCGSPGKHPVGRLVPHGIKDATTARDAIIAWWSAAPDANIGLAAGHGWWALDIDGAEGAAALQDLIARNGPLPPTPTQQTARGRHLLFELDGTAIRNEVRFRPGLDTRSAGGYIVAAPSVHVSGARYAWEPGTGPRDICPAPPPPAAGGRDHAGREGEP